MEIGQYKEEFCKSCFGLQRQLYTGRFTIDNDTYDRFVCCMCGHENKITIKSTHNNKSAP